MKRFRASAATVFSFCRSIALDFEEGRFLRGEKMSPSTSQVFPVISRQNRFLPAYAFGSDGAGNRYSWRLKALVTGNPLNRIAAVLMKRA
ncbi:hypothetical protein KCP76_14840 [Salmonella enterica subsp. enterica serovar Weltevreden]|nr:hypothetical protein KCP76_14840 [Salmonella enterica subsp. enterica serovar Weltevreden]